MKKIFFQNYTQYEIGLIHYQSIITVSNSSSGIYNTGKRATTAKEKNQCAVTTAQSKTSPMAPAAFILLNMQATIIFLARDVNISTRKVINVNKKLYIARIMCDYYTLRNSNVLRHLSKF